MKKYLFILTVLLGVSIIFSACEKESTSNQPAYAGTWELIETDEDGPMKTTLVLTASTIKMSIEMSYDDENWINAGGFEGTLAVVGETATITITKIGVVVDFDIEEMATVIEWYTSADAEFAENVEDFGGVTETVNIAVSGNKLTITIPAEDEEEDDEVMVFTKK